MAIWRPDPQVPVRFRVPPPELFPLQFVDADTSREVMADLTNDPIAVYQISSEVVETPSSVVRIVIATMSAEGEEPQQQAVIESNGGGDSGRSSIPYSKHVHVNMSVSGAGTAVGLRGSANE